VRLDKLLAHAGYGTRKDVRQLIKNKSVTVDGRVTTKSNVHVEPEKQLIKVDQERVHYKQYIYMMLNKPPNYVSATVDRYDRTVLDLLPDQYRHFELSPVGRLDKDTEGLLLLTNDGQLNHALTSPKREIFKTYYAKVDGCVTDLHVEQFKDGIILDDGYKTKKAYLCIEKSGGVSEIKLSISEGKFHQVKRMFRAIGMEVLYLKRLSIEGLHLDESLRLGEMRELTTDELDYALSLKKRRGE